VPSPLRHLLKDDMKETDETPAPQWGHPNAPPVIGAIHKQPRDENVSPLKYPGSKSVDVKSSHSSP